MESFTIRIGKLSVSFQTNNSNIIFRTLKRELGLFPSTDQLPDIEFSFLSAPLSLPDGILASLNTTFVSNSGVYIKFGRFFYKIYQEKHWCLDIFVDYIYPRSLLRKLQYKYKKFRHWNYLYLHEDLVRDFIYNIFDYVIQLVMCAKYKQTFIHASSVDFEGKGILFSSIGGVGKTTLMTKLIFDYSCKFLADDLAIIDENFIYFNPKFLQIYPYNILNNSVLKKQLLANRSFFDLFNWYYKKWRRGNKATRRRVSPFDLFGEEKIALLSPLKWVFFLRPIIATDKRNVSIFPIDPEILSSLCSNILLFELWPLSNILSSVYSVTESSFLPSLDDFLFTLKSTYLKIFSGKKCYLVDIPRGCDHNFVLKRILEHL